MCCPRAANCCVIDQFEEVFTLVEDKAEVAHFLNSLHAAVADPRSPLHVILTLRADFYDRPLLFPHFSELMRQHTEVVVPLTADELAHAIREPAERTGAVLETGLVTAIVADVNEQPGALPLLQYALTELFERREGRLLTKAAYQSIGGVSGALAKRAEEVYASLAEAGQSAAQQLFLRLVTLGEGTEDTRRRTLRTELEGLTTKNTRNTKEENLSDLRVLSGSKEVEAVIEAFGKSRLLSFDRDPVTRGPTVEVAHEALLREWRRLREWLDASRTDVRWQRQLASAAADWEGAQRDPSFLLTGSRLAQFEGWAAGNTISLTQAERAYLDASIAERDQHEAAERERQRHELETARKLAEAEKQRAEEQARAAKQLRQRAWILTVALVIAGLLAVTAFIFGQQATQNALRADANASTAQAANTQQVAQRSTAQAASTQAVAGAQNAATQ